METEEVRNEIKARKQELKEKNDQSGSGLVL